MAAGAKFSPPFAILEGNYNNKENGTIIDDNSSLKQSNAKPPKHISVVRHSLSSALLSSSTDSDPDEGSAQSRTPTPTDETPMFLPVFRSGSCSEKGPKRYMEDEHICIDNLREHLRAPNTFPSPGAFYGVFDGHGGKDAAYFVRNNLLKYIVEDSNFPDCVEKAIKSSFVKADHVFGDDTSLDTSSGTTALTALILGRKMIIANAGDCRAVLGKRGKAIELSKDHKPSCSSERQRIERLGGVVFDGYLNGQLSVARALGDWHMKKGPRSCSFPLSSEPELHETILARGDEFLLLACDGLWDVMSSQCAITMARRELMLHNDPERCSKELVKEALKRDTCDNLTIIIVCFSTDPPQKIEVHPTRRRSISAEGLTVLKGALDNIP